MLPAKYTWLNDVGTLPKMLTEGIKLLGTVETPGAANNPIILGWAKDVGLARAYSADEVAWCGLFIAKCAQAAGKPVVKDPLWALNWGKWGDDAGQPELGDVLTFIRNGGGHVALYVGEDSACYHVLGGNQHDAVNIMRIEKTRLKAARNLYRTGPPASAKPYILESSGVVSTNEA